MPPVTKKPTTVTTTVPTPISKPVIEAPKAVAMIGNRPILYPHYEVKICCSPSPDGKEYEGPVTYEMMKQLLRWETEPEYTARLMKTGIKESKAKFGDEYQLKNYAGEKVRCWNNAKNRPFDPTHAGKIGQDVLNKNFEMNCENFIIGQTGIVISGQHRGAGFMLAVEEWRATQLKGGEVGHWQAIWPTEPVLETMIAFGCREDPKVIRTIDNVKARTLADSIFTSPVFGALGSVERKECSRMMDYAVDLLWKRTKQATSWDKYQTHSSSLDFLDKHPKIKDCVKHLFDCNRDRIITNLGLSAGQAAAMMYLMGSSNTDDEDYHYLGSPKNESQLTWDNWDHAVTFFKELVTKDSERMEPVRKALAELRDEDTGAAPPQKVYHMLLSLAWNAYSADFESPITEIDVDVKPYIKWSEAKEREIIVEEPTVGGIDCGVVKGGGEEDEVLPSPEEQEAEKQRVKDEADAKRAAEVQERLNAAKQKPQKKEEELPNPLVEKKQQAAAKGKPVFSDEERQKLLGHLKPTVTTTPAPLSVNPGGRGPNNEPAPKAKKPKK